MSKQRDLYFEKHIKNQPTAILYLKALAESKYRTHRRMSSSLHEVHTQMMLESARDYQEKIGESVEHS